jgi:predicted nucleotidyltransferase
VGRIYKPNERLENILEREMSRLKIVMDKRIAAQDIELEEKALVARGKKK